MYSDRTTTQIPASADRYGAPTPMFSVLGPLEVRMGGQDYAPTAPKILQLLGLLLMHPGRIVQTDSIIEELWPEQPPRSVRTTMQTYVYQLRRCMEKNRLADNGDEMLATKPPGYVLRIEAGQTDVFAFSRHCRNGRGMMAEQRHEDAVQEFRAGLALWSGPPLANVNCGPVLSAYAVDLQEQHRSAQRLRIAAEIDAGLHQELVGELRSLVSANPFDESLYGQLMRVLSRSGRRFEALATFRDLRARLNEDLGLDPSPELQRLHQDLLEASEQAAA